MGLDMYLNRKYSKFRKDDGTLSDNWNDLKFDKFGRSNKLGFTENVGYWRKANYIHRWFVDNVQNGNDDCKEYCVSIKKLHELRDICFDILSKLHGTEIRVPKKYVDEFKEMNRNVYNCSKIQRITIDVNNLKTVKDLTGYHALTESQIKKCDCRTKLPTQKGFFFGSYEYDGWYLQSLVETIEMLDELFEKHEEIYKKINEDIKNNIQNATRLTYYYQASW